MKKIIIIAGVIIFSAALGGVALAHRSGCHSWHSCPSDTGSYICGDKGYCSACPNNKYCKDHKPIKKKRTR